MSGQAFSPSIQVFEYLYDRHAAKVFGFISNYTNTRQQAEKYLVMVFCKVWQHIDEFDGNGEKKFMAIVFISL